eukprot:CAMPEP_0173330324 /NCGR_PEP_ID=MMETSP1144-20121109/3189_1 /TAXON_ID=483371 /ORGANISM="non described non described, Strain CCMP2298" /LENGTH=297 /DNA_ID=CAMNT_0014274995 /DNA_START=579 /DNA_END=1470 /DNA_ORIENTATION=-
MTEPPVAPPTPREQAVPVGLGPLPVLQAEGVVFARSHCSDGHGGGGVGGGGFAVVVLGYEKLHASGCVHTAVLDLAALASVLDVLPVGAVPQHAVLGVAEGVNSAFHGASQRKIMATGDIPDQNVFAEIHACPLEGFLAAALESPSPSCPKLLAPQPHTSPDSNSTRVWLRPVLIFDTPVLGRLTLTGSCRTPASPVPNWPQSFLPMAATVPSSSRANECMAEEDEKALFTLEPRSILCSPSSPFGALAVVFSQSLQPARSSSPNSLPSPVPSFPSFAAFPDTPAPDPDADTPAPAP